VEALKTQLQQTSLRTVKESDFKAFAGKEQLTKEEAIKLQREVQQLDLMLKGYQEENEKQVHKNKGLDRDMKTLQEKLLAEQKRVKELQ